MRTLKMDPPDTINGPVTPRIHVRGQHKLVWYQNAAQVLYFFDTSAGTGSNCNTWVITKITLPTTYSAASYDIGYSQQWVSIVKKDVNAFWLAKFDSVNSASLCHIKQDNTVGQTTCASCGVVGDDVDKFLIAGKYQNKLQILIVKKDLCVNDAGFYTNNIQVTLPAPYTTADWYFSKADKKDARTAIAAITRKLSSTTNVLLFYTKKSGANTYPIK